MRYCFVKPLQKDILIWQQPKEVTAAWRLLSAFKERKWYKRFSVSASLCFYSKSLYWIQMRWTVKKKWVNFPICLRWCFLGGGEWYPDTDPLQSDQCSNHYSSPKESYWFFFFFFLHFSSTFFSPGYKSSYAIWAEKQRLYLVLYQESDKSGWPWCQSLFAVSCCNRFNLLRSAGAEIAHRWVSGLGHIWASTFLG